MSKTTRQYQSTTPILLGGLVIAAGIFAIAALRKKKASETVETIVETCEGALAKLIERTRTVAA
jgi:hypothetical protein